MANLIEKLRFKQPCEAILHDLRPIQYAHFRKNLPFLYLTLMFGVVSGAVAFSPETSIIFRVILPCIVGAACCWRMTWWFLKRNETASAETMNKMIPRTTMISAAIGTICGLWAVFGWMEESSNFRYYIPAFMALGAFSTAFCLSTMPRTATYAVVSGVLPISIMLLTSGTMVDKALGLTIGASTLFLIGLIIRQYKQMITMIELQNQMHEIAHTDSLTGLLNRRALHELLTNNVQDGVTHKSMTLAILDLDGFKPINDMHGHHMGDALLETISQRMSRHVGEFAHVARLGGDEFAILFFDHPAIFCEQASAMLMHELNAPYLIDGQNLPIGISYGLDRVEADQPCKPADMMMRADKKLYAMKAKRKPAKPAARRESAAA